MGECRLNAKSLSLKLLGETRRTRRARLAGLMTAVATLAVWFAAAGIWRTPLVPIDVTCLVVDADGADGGFRTLDFDQTTAEYRQALRRELETSGQTVEDIGGRLRLSLAGTSQSSLFGADGPIDSPETFAHWVSYGAMLRLIQARMDLGLMNRATLETFTVANPATGQTRVLDPGNCKVMEQFVLVGGRFAAE